MTVVVAPQSHDQRQDLLAAEREAHRKQPRSFKDDAISEKIVSIEPNGTGPTPTETLDPEKDRPGKPKS